MAAQDHVSTLGRVGMQALPEVKGDEIMGAVQYAKCPFHRTRSKETTWRPSRGLDPRLREYCCHWVGGTHAFFKIGTNWKSFN